MGASPGLPVYLKRHSFIIKRFCVENPETNQKFSFRSNTWKLQTNPIWYFCSRWSVYSQTDSGRSSSPPWFPSETGFFFLTGFFFGAFSPWWDHFCCLFHPAAFTFWWHLPLMPPSQIALKPEWLKAAAAAALRLLYQTEKPVCKCSCCWKADGGEKRLFQHPAPQRQAGGGQAVPASATSLTPLILFLAWGVQHEDHTQDKRPEDTKDGRILCDGCRENQRKKNWGSSKNSFKDSSADPNNKRGSLWIYWCWWPRRKMIKSAVKQRNEIHSH